MGAIAPAHGGGSGVEDRARGVDGEARSALDVADEQRACEREDDPSAVAVHRVGGDAAGTFAQPFAPSPLLRWEVGRVGVEQFERIAEELLAAARDIDDPEAVDRVGPAAAASEQHPLAVRGDRHVSGRAERQALGAGVLSREGVGHAGHATRARR